MKDANKVFKVLGLVFTTIGAYFTLNLLYKTFAGEVPYIHNSDISGVPWLIIGIICLLIYRKHVSASETSQPTKTKFIWFILIVLMLSLFNVDTGFIFTDPMSLSFYLSAAASVIATAITLIYIYKLNYLKKDILKWTHLLFGLMFVVFFYQGFSGQLEDATSLLYPPFLFTLALLAVFWVLFYRHLTKAINNHKIVLVD